MQYIKGLVRNSRLILSLIRVLSFISIESLSIKFKSNYEALVETLSYYEHSFFQILEFSVELENKTFKKIKKIPRFRTYLAAFTIVIFQGTSSGSHLRRDEKNKCSYKSKEKESLRTHNFTKLLEEDDDDELQHSFIFLYI